MEIKQAYLEITLLNNSLEILVTQADYLEILLLYKLSRLVYLDKIKPLNEEPVNEYSKQTNFSDNIVRPQSENHARELNRKIAAESQKEKESWLVPGFGFIAVMVLLIGIILGFLGAFGGNSLVDFENGYLYI